MTDFSTEDYLLTRIKTFQPTLYVKVEPNLAGDGSHTLMVHKANDQLNSVLVSTAMPLDIDPEDDDKHRELADKRFDDMLIHLGIRKTEDEQGEEIKPDKSKEAKSEGPDKEPKKSFFSIDPSPAPGPNASEPVKDSKEVK